MVHGLETLIRINDEASESKQEPKPVRRVAYVVEERSGVKIVLWMEVTYGLSMADTAKICALNYAKNCSRFESGTVVEVIVKPEDPLPEQTFKIRVDTVATWINPREGCGDDVAKQNSTARSGHHQANGSGEHQRT